MVEEEDLKQWRDAGHVARRTLEGIKGEIVAGKQWSEVIDSAERFIRRHGGKAAFGRTSGVGRSSGVKKFALTHMGWRCATTTTTASAPRR